MALAKQQLVQRLPWGLQKGHKTVVIDFDVGLRNLDLILGCERRVVYDFINVINGEASINQALIRDKIVICSIFCQLLKRVIKTR